MSKIAWTDKTWNPVRGCSRVSAGCENCYAERFAHRNLGGHYEGLTRMTSHGPRWTGEVRCIPEKLEEPLHWRKPRRVFANSMSDLFHEKVPDEFLDKAFAVMARAGHHQYQLLTKRSERMRAYVSDPGRGAAVARAIGRIGDRRPRQDLAVKEATREGRSDRRRVRDRNQNQPLPARSCRVHDARRLPIGDDDYQGQEDHSLCAQGCLDALQRADPSGPHDQSPQRSEGRQSPQQSGGGDLLTAAPARTRNAQCEPEPASRRAQPEGSAHGKTGQGDPPPEGERCHGEDHRRTIRDETKGDLGDLPPEDLAAHLDWPLPNVWLGVSVEDQPTADERIPLLLQTPAAVRWVSYEPALAAVDFSSWLWLEWQRPETYGDLGDAGPMISWLAVGGESGPGARPCHVNSIRSARDQCHAAGVPCFIKQVGSRPFGPRVNGHPDNILGEWPLKSRNGANPAEWPEDLRVREWPTPTPAGE